MDAELDTGAILSHGRVLADEHSLGGADPEADGARRGAPSGRPGANRGRRPRRAAGGGRLAAVLRGRVRTDRLGATGGGDLPPGPRLALRLGGHGHARRAGRSRRRDRPCPPSEPRAGGGREMECADGKMVWIVETEPA
jgi:hypothetical protein